MKKLTGLMIFIATFGLNPTVFAVEIIGVNTTGKILNYSATSYGVFIFTVSNKTAPKACDKTARYAFHSDEAWAKEVIAAVMVAKVTGNTVAVQGAGTCNNWNNAEDFSHIDVQ